MKSNVLYLSAFAYMYIESNFKGNSISLQNFNECLHDNILYRQYHIHLKYIINKYQSALDVFTYLIKRELS